MLEFGEKVFFYVFLVYFRLGGFLFLMVGRRWGNFEVDFILYRVFGRMGILVGKLVFRGGSGYGIMWLFDFFGFF